MTHQSLHEPSGHRTTASRPIDLPRLAGLLCADGLDVPVTHLAVTGSTQDEARTVLMAGAPHGALVVAECQTEGRGRRGRKWVSAPGGLTCSLVIRDAWHAGRSWPTIAAAVGVARAVEAQAGVTLQVKWPNDLVFGARKAGGVLVEACGEAVVLGLGLNVNDSPLVVDGVPAVSIAEIAGRLADRTALLAACAIQVLGLICAPEGRDAARAEWAARSSVRGRQVVVDRPRSRLAGLVEGFGPAGELLVRTDAGKVVTVVVGEASLRTVADG